MASRPVKPARAGGFSLVELLVAVCITVSLMGSVLVLVSDLHLGFGAESERADGQQRLRVAVEALSRDLGQAGAGAQQGLHAGPLRSSTASLFPFRQGAAGADPPGTVRADTLTMVYALAQNAAQTTLGQPLAARSGAAVINLDPGCPTNDPACGFAPGMDVMVFDDTGSYDTFRVLTAQPGALQLQHNMADTPQSYAAGARIVEAASHTYSLRTDPGTDTFQLMHYDGVASDAAVVDHVVGLTFEYFADPAPPVLLRPVNDPTGPWTTYGPKPPSIAVQATAYPAGENCAFQIDGATGQPVPRLPMLGDGLGDGSATLVRLTDSQLRDGPWCPDATNPHRYDADLLRVRRVAVTLRIEAALSAFRGPAGVLFARGGTSRAARRWVADQEVRFDIAPRNLNVGR